MKVNELMKKLDKLPVRVMDKGCVFVLQISKHDSCDEYDIVWEVSYKNPNTDGCRFIVIHESLQAAVDDMLRIIKDAEYYGTCERI